MSNLGLQLRPDLVDGHTIHWHGFRNAIPFYDGVPESSISVAIGHDFTYVYRPKDSGTYMYHCHFEDVEHVTMGMHGIVFVKPSPGDTVGLIDRVPAQQKAYGTVDGDMIGETRYDREFAIMLSEIDTRAHFGDAHIQATDWTDFHADFWTMNGRAYPDTLEPNGIRDDKGQLRARKWDRILRRQRQRQHRDDPRLRGSRVTVVQQPVELAGAVRTGRAGADPLRQPRLLEPHARVPGPSGRRARP